VTTQINPFELSDETLSHRFQQLFEPHRQRQLNFYFPSATLVNIEEDEKLEAWSDSYILIRPLRYILPFGQHLTHSQYTSFLDNSRNHLVDYAQEQLLYWHLSRAASWSGHPVENIVVCENNNYF
jgi:hypothetical protein